MAIGFAILTVCTALGVKMDNDQLNAKIERVMDVIDKALGRITALEYALEEANLKINPTDARLDTKLRGVESEVWHTIPHILRSQARKIDEIEKVLSVLQTGGVPTYGPVTVKWFGGGVWWEDE